MKPFNERLESLMFRLEHGQPAMVTGMQPDELQFLESHYGTTLIKDGVKVYLLNITPQEVTDRDIIRVHLYEYLQEITPGKVKPTWFDVLAFCVGYYGHVNIDMIMVVREFQREGKVE